MAILAVLGVLIVVLATVASCYALGKGLLQPLQEIWKKAEKFHRRRLLVDLSVYIGFCVLMLALDFVAPFGPDTFAYVLGGFGVLIFISLHLIVFQQVRQTHGSKHGS